MESGKPRAVQAVIDRVRAVLSGHDNKKCLVVAIASTFENSASEVVDYVLDGLHARRVREAGTLRAFAITTAEWRQIVAEGAVSDSEAQIALRYPRTVECELRLATALGQTLCEKQAAEAWARASGRLAAVAALQMPDAEDRVVAVLDDCVVRNDLRRVEELAAELQDGGEDVLELTKMSEALAACYTR